MATSLADILAKAKQKMGNKDRTVKPKDGRSVWRILPGWDPKEPNLFFQSFGQHYIKNMEGEMKAVLVCQDKTFEQPCEICDMVADAIKAAPNDEIRKKLEDMKSSQRFLLNAIQVDQDKEKVVILEIGSMLLGALVAQLEEYPELFHPEKGNDIVITREGTGMNTKYSATVRSREKSIAVPKSALMNLNNLREYVEQDSEAKLAKARETLGLLTGTFTKGSAAAAALAAPDADYSDDVGADINDEIPDFDAKAAAEKELADVEDAEEVVSESVSDEDFGEELDDEDIEKMLEALK